MTDPESTAPDDRHVRDEEIDDEAEPVPDSHLEAVEAGAGCTDIWEHLAEVRDE